MGPASRSRHALYESVVFCDVVTHPRAQIFPRALCWRPLSLFSRSPIRRTHTGQTIPIRRTHTGQTTPPLPFRRLAPSERYTAHSVETSIGGRRLPFLLSFCVVLCLQYVSQGRSRHVLMMSASSSGVVVFSSLLHVCQVFDAAA